MNHDENYEEATRKLIVPGYLLSVILPLAGFGTGLALTVRGSQHGPRMMALSVIAFALVLQLLRGAA